MSKKNIIKVLCIFIFNLFIFGNVFSIHGAEETLVLEEEYTLDGIVYHVFSDHAEVLRCGKGVSEIVIPAEVKNKKVTVIADEAFFNNVDLKNIIIPDSITEIGDYAFFKCINLNTVTIPDSVTRLGAGAFYRCYKLENVMLSESLTEIKDYTFVDCSLLETITIPDSVKSIGDNVFYRCSKLSNVDLPKSLETIGTLAFFYCSSLSDIDIPETVISIGGGSFDSTPWLKNSTQEFVIVGDGVLLKYSGDSKVVIIPDSVKCISGFEDASLSMSPEFLEYFELNMKSVVIPDSVTKIEVRAFFNAFHLQEVTIPDSVESIGDFAFQCTSLSKVVIPEGVKSIGKAAFEGNLNLKSIDIPDSVSYIGDGAFDGNYDMKLIYSKGSYAEAYVVGNVINTEDDKMQDETYINYIAQGNNSKIILISVFGGVIGLGFIGFIAYRIYKKKKSS